LKSDPQYRSTAEAHPRAKLFFEDPQPGTSAEPAAEKLPDGGQRFTASYLIRDGCNSCELLGHADFSFLFNSSGDLKKIAFKSFHKS
jgi:hypothetical protein